MKKNQDLLMSPGRHRHATFPQRQVCGTEPRGRGWSAALVLPVVMMMMVGWVIAVEAGGAALAAEGATPAAGGAAATGRRPTFAELFGDDVIARGKGVEVRRSQLEGAFLAFRSNLASRGQGIPEDQRLLREAQLLERLVITQLLTQRANAEDRKQAKELGERFLTETKKGTPSEEAFQRQLKAMGMSPEQFQKRVDEQSLAEAVIGREVKSTIQVSDADVREFYDKGVDLIVKLLQEELEKLVKDIKSSPEEVSKLKERIDLTRKDNLARLEAPERVRIQHVFFAGRDVQSERELTPEQLKQKRARAEKIRERALAGEDFARLIRENSEDRGVPETKGEYTFGRADRFSEEFKSASFSLSPGQVSDVVSTPFGYHVIKLVERIPAKKTEFEKAAKDVKEFLQQQRVQQAMPEYFARLRKESNVEVLDAKYRNLITGNVDPTKPD
jgi:parvulin-like peptidyl-prolyl isomerase